jgi:hypothetical protein
MIIKNRNILMYFFFVQVALTYLDDPKNAKEAYEHSLAIDG